MRIGVTVRFQFSYFSGGGGHASLAIAEAVGNVGHTVSLVNIDGDKDWWEDALPLKDMWKGKLTTLKEVKEPFDLLLECDPMLLTVDIRKNITKRAVWVIRKPVLLHDVEATLFPFEQRGRDLNGIQEVWVMNHSATRDDIQYLEVLTRRPVRLVPWLWSPSAVEAQRRGAQLPVWGQIMALDQFKGTDWSVHIAETNFSASSSATIPLVVLREAQLRKSAKLQRTVKLHNIDHLKKNDYFHNNVTQHCTVEGLTNEYLGRQRICDWVMDPKSFLLAHSRFLKIRPYVLEALWCGIPVIHNLPLVKEIGHGIERFYYSENEIGEGCMAISQMDLDFQEKKGFFAAGALEKIRAEILRRFTPYSPDLLNEWKRRIDAIAGTALVPIEVPSTVASTKTVVPELHVSTITNNEKNTSPFIKIPRISSNNSEHPSNKILTIGFCDMWENFQEEYNPFLLLLRDLGADVKGVKETGDPSQKLDLLIFGPFGSTWKSAAGVPKIHFTGENSDPIEGEGVVLNLGFQHRPGNPRYMRLPLWMLEINWWNADADRLVNPKPIPLEAALKNWEPTIADRKKFCAFVVSNPSNQMRNKAFWWMNEKKEVDSAGRLFNTVGSDLFAGLGGGGGELKKHEFLKSYKYCFAYENTSSPGYTTEKLLHAKAAGCIPLYWGDPQVEADFDPRGFVDMRNVKTKEEFLEKINAIEGSEEKWREIVRTPALTVAKAEEVREHLKSVGRKILGCVGTSTSAVAQPAVVQQAPQVVSVYESKSQAQFQKESAQSDIIYATAFSWKFLSSFELWTRSLKERGVSRAIAYCMSDVPPPSFDNLKNIYSWIIFIRIPQLDIPGFLDWHAPQHYAWKLWCLQDMTLNNDISGKTIIYTDSGAFVCKEPKEWIEKTQSSGVCLLEDEEQINRHWCHTTFCSKLNVTEDEKSQHQLMAGLIAFVAGHPVANTLFTEAWKWGQQRDVIEGPKWQAIGTDGKPYGHRHDQSILSIVSARMGVARLPLRSVYCDRSLRDTYRTGKSIYVHRGNFKTSEQFAPLISEAHVINLERRADRMERFQKNHEGWAQHVRKFNAYDGRSITLTPALARLFRPHDFGWKKAILGCALSHLELWLSLLTDTADIDSYLIMEDDVKFKEGWQHRWNEAAAHAPDDWDVIYLGGILPPNRDGFEKVKEKVNPYFSRIAMNQIFGQQVPSRYFHFCNYSYILSRKGAQKIIDVLKSKDGYWTSADHMICNNHEKMNLYFLDPLVAGCYQDDDPKYCASAFNNYSRVDSFDSDLWNNDERFSQEEIMRCIQASQNAPIAFGTALEDARSSDPTKKQDAVKKEVKSEPKEEQFYIFNKADGLDLNYYEREWIQEIFNTNRKINFKQWDCDTKGLPPYVYTVVYRKPDTATTYTVAKKLNDESKPFILLHLSDEHCSDPIDIYSLPMCKAILRNYVRNDIPSSIQNKVKTIPLGPHFKLNGQITPAAKKYVWSFHGTEWHGRNNTIAMLNQLQPNSFELYKTWQDANQLKEDEYCSKMREAIFIPCLRGNNVETYRFYEALELGAIPLIVEEQIGHPYYSMLRKHMPSLVILAGWFDSFQFINEMFSNPAKIEQYHRAIYTEWLAWKDEIKNFIKNL